MRELEDALAVEPVVRLLGVGLRTAGVVEAEEVEREVAVAVLCGAGTVRVRQCERLGARRRVRTLNEFHAQHLSREESVVSG